MANLAEVGAWIEQRLPELLAEYDVPAAAVAVSVGGDVVDTAAGVLSKATAVDATPDSVFQVGSITKVWTATLVMQLVDEGLVDLDTTVRTYLPEFVIGDDAAAAAITVRQLLCHVAGFEGDIFTDTGRGDDCVEKYVATLGDTPQLFGPGERFSYNNAGYCVLGRIVEVLRDKPFDTCVRDHLFTPLGLTHAANGADEAILFRAAVGHIQPAPEADSVPAPMWSIVRSNAPAGSMLTMRARDLLGFARMHLDGGTAPDGTAVLSGASVKAMQERQVDLPDLGLLGDGWGLGWELYDVPGGPVIGHDGSTIGQNAFLRLVPGRDVAVAVLTNGGLAYTFAERILTHVLAELADVELGALPAPTPGATVENPERYVGTYASAVADTTVTLEDGRLWAERTPKGELAALAGPGERSELVPWRGDTLLPSSPTQGIYMPHAFVGDDGHGRALYLHTGRADRRVDA
ncbi:CubicO group peptidase (beta-lactamase class C family) [Mumia flava]|uniref:CubicO group peptidase (Beta-lactamase class C family) n=1 Tax=Mumia flava TaxID=1348852 RepID=A0A0B2BPB7_9ACTN|nr:serine hydrolase [Mumia flava]PJJ53695.1 CubicO group peptidase (beta-lactamase class C family) [Mumia flava]